MIRKIISCMDLRALPLGLATVFAGCAAAGIHGNFEILPTTLCLLFVIFAQISANLYHRYCDARFGYGENIDRGLQDNGSMPMTTILREACMAFTLVAILLGIGIMSMSNWWVILVGIAMYGISFFNSAGPYPLARSPWNWVPPFLFFGPVGVVSTCLVLADYEGIGHLWYDVRPGLFLGCAVGLFAVNSLLYYNYMNVKNDAINGKRTLRVVFGARTVRTIFFINGLLIYAFSLPVVFLNNLPHPWLILSLPFVCVLVNIYLWWNMLKDNHNNLRAMAWVNNLSALFYAFTAFCIFISNHIGDADDSVYRFF